MGANFDGEDFDRGEAGFISALAIRQVAAAVFNPRGGRLHEISPPRRRLPAEFDFLLPAFFRCLHVVISATRRTVKSVATIPAARPARKERTGFEASALRMA